MLLHHKQLFTKNLDRYVERKRERDRERERERERERDKKTERGGEREIREVLYSKGTTIRIATDG